MVFIMPGIDRAAPERTLTRSGSAGSPNFLPAGCLHPREGGLDLRLDRLGKLAARVVIVGADLGGDREAGRNRNADHAHLGQVGPLAAEQLLHVGSALGSTSAESINVLWLISHDWKRLPETGCDFGSLGGNSHGPIGPHEQASVRDSGSPTCPTPPAEESPRGTFAF